MRQALILAGGRGTRLGALTDACPKPLLAVNGQPFLAYLLWLLGRQGVNDIILSIGYRAEMFRDAVPATSSQGWKVRHRFETEPAGTGGAVWLARAELDDVFFVLNGDTISDFDCQALARALVREPTALAAIALREVENVGRYGRVQLVENRVRAFAEKSAAGGGLINGGVYCLKKQALDGLPDAPCSLEKDLFPALAARDQLLGEVFAGYFIDIGLPETLAAAQTELPAWQSTVAARCGDRL